ncbi:MAG: CoA transferase, partial [Candidatus Nanopelagicales bacterium]
MSGVLAGLKVVELGDGLSVAQVGNVFADFGAEVISIEPPHGISLRNEPGFLFMGRGKKSAVLDCREAADAEIALKLMSQADVIVTSVRPKTLKAWGLDADAVLAVNPRAVYGIVTGWGLTGPLADVKGYESLVMASIGGNSVSQRLTFAPGPNFVTVPWATWSASQTLLHAIFSALRERETSGMGQVVDASLGHALGGQDPWNQFNAVLAQRFPDALNAAAPVAADGSPNSSYAYKLLVAITKDGHWLQFSQVQPRLFKDFVLACGLGWMYDDPKWSEFVTMGTDTVMLPADATAEMKFEFWDLLLDIVKGKTLTEWQAIFDEWPNVFAEVFRRGTDVLHHPQLAIENQLVTIKDRRHGDVLMPGPLIRLSGTPAELGADAPHLDEHGDELRKRAAGITLTRQAAPENAPADLPLKGLTIMELGTFYAAPNGSTMLTDL